MKRILRCVCCFLLISFLLGILSACASGVNFPDPGSVGNSSEKEEIKSDACGDPSGDPEKKYFNKTVDERHSDRKIDVYMMPSVSCREYTVADFSDINCVELRDYSTEEYRCFCLTLGDPSRENMQKAVDILEARPDVYFVEPLPMGRFNVVPGDPYYGNTTSGYRKAMNKIQMASAWNIHTGSSSVTVGVIDSGIDAAHPELSGRISTSLSCNFSSAYNTALEDDYGHGTHVAGLIGARANNSGIAGICWNVTLVSLRVDDGNGYPDPDAIIEAVNYAAREGIDILNISASLADYNSRLKTAIDNYPGLVVCAAGNYYINIDEGPFYPACYPSENILSVGAINNNNSRWMDDWNDLGSNYGNSTVDIFAPGELIESCYPGGSFIAESGTSIAAPLVSGVAALLLSKNPNATSSELKNIICYTVTYASGLISECAYDGYLNAYAALSHSHPGYAPVGASGHRINCPCGFTISEHHTFSESGGVLVCSKCGYSSISLNQDSELSQMQ